MLRNKIWPGRAYPLGATYDGAGTNFSLFSEVATRVELCLFDEAGTAVPGWSSWSKGGLNDATYQEAVTALPALPDSGSKWVADKGSAARKPGQMRQIQLPKFQQN